MGMWGELGGSNGRRLGWRRTETAHRWRRGAPKRRWGFGARNAPKMGFDPKISPQKAPKMGAGIQDFSLEASGGEGGEKWGGWGQKWGGFGGGGQK